MQTQVYGTVVCFLGALGSASAGSVKSSVPFIYVIDYSDKWIKDPAAAQIFGDQPPDVLHIGKAVPVTHNWGPIPLLAGENQYTGGPDHTLDRDAIRLLTPAELEQKIQELTAAVERLHAAGIPRVIPYICFFSFAGDHETHEGLWKFYDHWEDYARWMGPKPPEGPSDWVTKDATGQRIETPYGLTPPYFAPLHRYAACPNNPSWNQFIIAVVRLIAQCGYDGVFVDNSTLGGDSCSYCQAAFAKWVGENFDPATLQRACGVEEVGQITPDNPHLAVVLERWHNAVIRDRLAMLREVGAEIKPGFQTFANVCNYQRVLPLGDGCDLFMMESISPPGWVVEGEFPAPSEALIDQSSYRTNLGGLSCSYHSRCKTIGLWYGSDAPGWEKAQELALAEGAANGGRYAINSGGEPQKKYERFFEQYGEVGAGLVPYGPVTLLYAYWGGNPGEIGRTNTRTVANYLSAQHVLYRGLVDRDLEAEDLHPAPEQTLILVCPHYDLTEAQIQALQQFLEDGGRVILEHADTRINFTPLREVLGSAGEKTSFWDWNNPPQLAPPLCGSEGHLRGVRFTSFVDPAPEPQRLVLHALNYNVSVVEKNPGQVIPMEKLTLRLPIPSAWERVRAVVYDPDQTAPLRVDCPVAGGVAQVLLPPLRIYQMVELSAE